MSRIQEMTGLFRDLVENGDVCSSLFLLLILFLVGAKVVEHVPHLAPWGKRSAFATFLMYVVLRTAATIPQTAEELTLICLRGLLAAGFGCALAWILIPVLTILWTHSAGALLRRVQRAKESLVRGRAEQRSARQREQERQAADRKWQKTAPQRERERTEAAARAAVEARAAAAAQKRREEGRMRAQLLFERHAKKLASSFPREQFEQFLERYMNDELAPEDVEQREQLLREMLTESLGTASQLPKFTSIGELATYFDARRQEIDALQCEKRIKDRYRTQIYEQEDNALQRFMKS